MQNNDIAPVECKNCGSTDIRYSFETNVLFCTHCRTTYVWKNRDEHSSAQKLDNAELNLHKFHDVAKAEQYYNEAAELNPGDFRCWWGLAKVKTDNFSNYEISLSELSKVEPYVQKALLTTFENCKETIQQIFDDYRCKVMERIDVKSNKIKGDLQSAQQKLQDKNIKLSEVKQELQGKKNERDLLNQQLSTMCSHVSGIKKLMGRYVFIWAFSGILAIVLYSLWIGNSGWEHYTSFGDAFNYSFFLPEISAIAHIASLVFLLLQIRFVYHSKEKQDYIHLKIENLDKDISSLDKKILSLKSEIISLTEQIRYLDKKKKLL